MEIYWLMLWDMIGLKGLEKPGKYNQRLGFIIYKIKRSSLRKNKYVLVCIIVKIKLLCF